MEEKNFQFNRDFTSFTKNYLHLGFMEKSIFFPINMPQKITKTDSGGIWINTLAKKKHVTKFFQYLYLNTSQKWWIGNNNNKRKKNSIFAENDEVHAQVLMRMYGICLYFITCMLLDICVYRYICICYNSRRESATTWKGQGDVQVQCTLFCSRQWVCV